MTASTSHNHASPAAPQTKSVIRHRDDIDPSSYVGQAPHPKPTAKYPVILRRPAGAGHQFMSAFFAITFTWLLLEIASLSTFHPAKWLGPRVGIPVHEEYSIPPGIHLDQCIEGKDWQPSYTGSPGWVSGAATYDLPLSSESLLIISRGNDRLNFGNVEMKTSPDQPRGHVTVQVRMSSYSDYILESLKACLIRRKENEVGVGVFTRKAWHPLDRPGFGYLHHQITVVFPEVEPPSTLFIKNFETDVPGYSQTIQDFGQKISFQNISLNGTKGTVYVKSLQGDVIDIRTTTSVIRGNFSATKLSLSARGNGGIGVNVNLTNSERWNTTFNAEADGLVKSNINLFSTTASAGSFSVNLSSSTGTIIIAFPTSSPLLNSSELHLNASTSKGYIYAALPWSYEGSFNIRTDDDKPLVELNSYREDPWGLGRRRRVSYQSLRKGEVTGDVAWGDYRGKGTISLAGYMSYWNNPSVKLFDEK